MNVLTGVWRATLAAMTSRPPTRWGWAAIENGELLTLASGEFDVFVTVDRNLSFQQNLGLF
jgi:hypothetical protein